jgi:TldD protein
LTARWHRRDLQVVGPRWVPESESEAFFSLDVELPWGRCGALATALRSEDAERLARSLVGRFRAREAAPPVSGRYPLLLAPGATAVLLHEAVGHALEADLLPVGADGGELLRAGPHAEARASAGATVAVATAATLSGLDILDDPGRAPRGVTRTTDDEGQPVQRRWLIRGGKVEQPIADGLFAARSGRWLPGSGFRGGRHDGPLPRMHHLELLPGASSGRELAAAANDGLFVPELDQGALDPRSGEVVLHAPCGRYIRGGELAEPCGPLTIRSRAHEILAAIAAVGDDSTTAGAGWCAKEGQRRAVWATAPSLALSPLAVLGGRSER